MKKRNAGLPDVFFKKRNRRGRFGSEDILLGNHRLTVHWDFDRPGQPPFPMLFYTPDMENTFNHYHIQLTRAQARRLRDWLDDFLKGKMEWKEEVARLYGKRAKPKPKSKRK